MVHVAGRKTKELTDFVCELVSSDYFAGGCLTLKRLGYFGGWSDWGGGGA